MTQRVALVTGGTRGIGASISEQLKKDGHRVVATYQSNDDRANEFSQKFDIPVFKWDVSDFTACQNGIAEVTKQVGPVSILINNAGITRDCMFHKMGIEQWDAVIRTNLGSCFNMTRCVVDAMREQKFGRIINISSINGQKGQIGQTNYSAAKAGLLGFTKALAQETAKKGITVNAVTPGYVGTDMVNEISSEVLSQIVAQIPVGRLGTPAEIARTVSFLASDNAGFITGSTLSINGGQYAA